MTQETAEEDRPRRLDLDVWWKVLAHAWPFRRHAVGLGVIAAILAACEVLLPFLVGRIVDEVTQHGAQRGLVLLGAAYLGVIVVLCLGILAFILLAGRIATGVCHDIRRAGFEQLQRLPFAYYDRRPVGWIMSRLTADCDRLARIIGWTMMDFVWGSVMLLGIAVMMLLLHWQLALMVLCVVPPLTVISLYFQRRLLETSRLVRKANAALTAAFNEAILGIRTTKALVREQESLAEFEVASGKMQQHTVQAALHSAVYVPLVLALGSTTAGLALWLGGARVVAGTLSIGTLVTFLNYASLFFHPVREMARQLIEVQMAQAAAERIIGLLDIEPGIRDAPAVQAAIAATAQTERPAGLAIDGLPEQIESVEFRDVCFAYKAGEPVLQQFGLTLSAGETIALVGPTGGGKSTIAALLCRFYEPTAGEILVNGIDYRQRSLHWYQSSLGIVLQTPHLFSGSIRENITYGDPAADEQQIIAAAKLVNAHSFIERQQDGYDAEVGEGGRRLSTGQKQLIALARAVIADPQIFIMDEATSSVDTETEHLIQKAIERVLVGRISVVIAHRLSTIRSADRILVIESGQIIESGNHEALFAQNEGTSISTRTNWRAGGAVVRWCDLQAREDAGTRGRGDMEIWRRTSPSSRPLQA